MNDKETKAPIYIATIVALILVTAAAYFVMAPQPSQKTENKTNVSAVVQPTEISTPTTTNAQTNISSATVSSTPILTSAPTIKCELCHTDPQNLYPHVNGGKLCINCHGSQVHNIHVGEGTVNLDCKTCHGFPPKIPTVQVGQGPDHYSVCEQCHAPPPDNTKPSHGNLIVIHLSRGKYCTNCHGTDIGVIHAKALANLANKTTTTTSTTSNISTMTNTTSTNTTNISG